MGIPAFYRWLVERYPRVIKDAIKEEPVTVNGVEVPIDTSKPNPNGMEFDNLYLDMNGIIHPCFHPDGGPDPKDYEEVFKAVFAYIDNIFSIIRPRKLLFMAIDGVAPRAKMNQQRTRRFRAAKEAADLAAAAAEEAKLKSGGLTSDASEQTHKLDSNVITPGTEFMALLSSSLQYYVHLRMNNDPGWRGIKVILSDATVPGEGEHKIMSYIRLQRNLPGFDPNTRHCLYGLDADLIMLALTTHEVHFSILREDLTKYFMKSKPPPKWKTVQEEPAEKQKYLLLHIWVLRDYLSYELRIPNSTMNTDLERLIDDFVFMCVFVGNDFLPNVPSLNIHEGAIDLLMTVYKKEFDKMGGYLTNSSEVNLKRVEHFLQIVGSHEDAIFRKRSKERSEWDRRDRRMMLGNKKPGIKGKTMWSSSNPNISKPISLAPGTINSTTIDGKIVVVDNIKLGERGWKGRFYAEKFEAKNEDAIENIRKLAVLKYIEGICWVMRYYFEGVCSWQWFYPYHYSPFASDFHGLDRLEIHFTLGEPFKPFDQLMGVLPAASAHALPLLYRKLMTDAMSPILDFYPTDFELDMNGKRHEWQAVCKLPFIKESRLLAEIANVEHSLTDEERKRNSLGLDFLYVHISHSLATKILSFYKRKKDHPKLTEAKVKRKINPNFSGGMNGYMYISDKPVLELEIISPIEGMELMNKNEVICVFYKLPPVHPHIPRPPKGVVFPKMSASKQDVEGKIMLWHEDPRLCRRFRGREPPKRPFRNAVSGSSFAKSAHQPVKEHYVEKKQQTMATEELDDHTLTDASCLTDSKETVCKEMVGNDEKSDLNGIKPGKKKKRKIDGDDHSVQNIDNGHVNADPSCQMNSIENVTEKRMVKDERSDVNGTKSGKKRKLRDASCQNNMEETLMGNDERSDMNGTKSGKKRKLRDASCQNNMEETLMGNDERSDVNGTKPENKGKLKDVVNGDDQSIKKAKKQKKNMPVEDDEQDIKGKKLKKKSILVEDHDQNIEDKKPKQKIHFEEDDRENIKEKRKMKSSQKKISLVVDDVEDTKEKKQKKKSTLIEDGEDTKEKKQKKISLVVDDVEDTKEKKQKKKSTLIEDGEDTKEKKQKKISLVVDDVEDTKEKKQKKKSTLIEDGEQIIKKKKEKKKITHLEDSVLVN